MIHEMVEVSPGVRLHTCAAGEGSRSALLLHGFPQTSHEWRHVAPALIEHGFRVVVPDYRGAGKSSKSVSGYDKWTMAADIRALLDHVKVGRELVLIGHDVGAMLALAFAFRFRDAVSHLVLIDAPLQGTTAMKEMRGDPRGWHIAFHQARDISEYLVHGKEREYVEYMIDVRIFDPSAISREDRDIYVSAYASPGAMRAAFELYRAFDEDGRAVESALAADGKLSVPTLTIGGEAGGLGQWMPKMAQEIAHHVDHRTAPRSGHWVPEENPRFVVDAIVDFVGDRR
jgi:pimeloyl-ACP methyl ester carboxylesterase